MKKFSETYKSRPLPGNFKYFDEPKIVVMWNSDEGEGRCLLGEVTNEMSFDLIEMCLKWFGDGYQHKFLDKCDGILCVNWKLGSEPECKVLPYHFDDMEKNLIDGIYDHTKGKTEGDRIDDYFPEIGGVCEFKDGIYNGEDPRDILTKFLDGITESRPEDKYGAWGLFEVHHGLFSNDPRDKVRNPDIIDLCFVDEIIKKIFDKHDIWNKLKDRV